MQGYDEAVLMCFLENQGKLFPEGDVVSSLEEAEAFLEECMAVVVDSAEEVQEYFEEEGLDMDGAGLEELLEADEVFEVGDGRYLIVEG
ncbi:MAG TPA: glyoxalase [Candidatus Eisenbergiella intestinipullorum]|nr:glyoxalase [Candidatus Eisenbergiella intestinipullorum]